MDESRKQFEQKIQHSYGKDYLVVNDDGDYVNLITADLWEFWQASREQLEGWVLIPKVPTMEMIEGFWGEIKHGQPEIDAATEAFNEMLKAVPSKN